mmetsp:Transcript_85245/g.275109  ORF Transcript_85245/g.275109 Transcript_85245/m.275109 type:complete len:437 (+) Transcript_85245:129-1439(+)
MISPPLACQGDESALKTLIPQNGAITTGQIVVLLTALFIKGGVLGAYLPFSTLWLDVKGYSARQIACVALVDALGSFMLPLVGTCIDKLRSHNTGFVAMLVSLSFLKLCYLPAAGSFTTLLLLATLTSPLMRAANSVLDALALYAFSERGNFGRARCVGDLGWGGLAVFTGWAMDFFGTEDSIFIIFSAMCFFLAVMWTAARPWMNSIRPDTKQMSTEEFLVQAKLLITRTSCPGALRALFMLILMGFGGGVVGAYELVLLKRMMGSGVMMGFVKAFGSMSALPVWYWMGPMMDRMGLRNVQLMGLFFMSFRLCVLGVIKHPWQVLFCEMFAGLGGFALAYCSITVFAGRVVDEDLKGTSQALIFTVYSGLGAGFGPLFASLIIEAQGLQTMYLVVSGVALAFFLVLALVDAVSYFVLGTYTTLEKEMLVTLPGAS